MARTAPLVLGSWADCHWRGATVQDLESTCPRCGASATLQEPVRSWTRDGGWVEQRSVRCRGTERHEELTPRRRAYQLGFGTTRVIRGCGLVLVEEIAVEGEPPAVGQQQQAKEEKEETTMGKPSATAHSERMKEVWRLKRERQYEEMERQRKSNAAARQVVPAKTERPSPVVEVEEAPVPGPGPDPFEILEADFGVPAPASAPPPPTFLRCARCGVDLDSMDLSDLCTSCTVEISKHWEAVPSPDPTEREPAPAPTVAEEPALAAPPFRAQEISLHIVADASSSVRGLADFGFRRRTVADKMRAAADQLGSITLREARGFELRVMHSIEAILAFVEASDAEGTEGAQVNQEVGLPT